MKELHPDTMQLPRKEVMSMTKRRRRDSNPRDAFDAYTISSRAPSTKLGDFSIFSHAIQGGQPRINQRRLL